MLRTVKVESPVTSYRKQKADVFSPCFKTYCELIYKTEQLPRLGESLYFIRKVKRIRFFFFSGDKCTNLIRGYTIVS